MFRAQPKLFTPLRIRQLDIKNRVWVSPMCQYSSEDGLPNDWHFVHLGSRAVGGAGLLMVEATAVVPEGRITTGDTGMWSDAHADAFKRIVKFIKEQNGCVPAIQLAHAGRKASTTAPWKGGGPASAEQGGWEPEAPSAIPFKEGWLVPKEMSRDDIKAIVKAFADAAVRSLEAGFQVVEIHGAHGYLCHSFLSPLTNHRTDEYGGSLENRCRFAMEIAQAVRNVWPQHLPVFMRISASDWAAEGGWDLAQSVELCKRLKTVGIDLIDCSSGGLLADAKIPMGPSYQVHFSDAIRRETGLLTGAVGMIREPLQAEQTLLTGQADAVFIARELLRDPYWPLKAAQTLKADIPWPRQYERAKDY